MRIRTTATKAAAGATRKSHPQAVSATETIARSAPPAPTTQRTTPAIPAPKRAKIFSTLIPTQSNCITSNTLS